MSFSDRALSLVRLPRLCGIVPPMVLPLRSSRSRFTSLPASSLMEPVRPLLPSWSSVTRRSMSALSPELHVTPYQLSAQGSWKYCTNASCFLALGTVVKFQFAYLALLAQSNPSHRAFKAPMSKACTVVGSEVGTPEGAEVGITLGRPVGLVVGMMVGRDVGCEEGVRDGACVTGALVGGALGLAEG